MTSLSATAGARASLGARLGISRWALLVWGATAIYIAVLTVESAVMHSRFGKGFDTAIYDQYLWLLANGHEPFSTILSRPMLGDHFQPGIVLLTPIYWVGLGVKGLFGVQSAALALVAPALYGVARAAGAAPRLAALVAALWLVSPATASANLYDAHLSLLVPPLLVASVLAAERRKPWLLGSTAVLAMSIKEDAALTYVALGLVLALGGRRRVGGLLALGALSMSALAHRVVSANGDSFESFGRRFAGDRGDSVGEALVWIAVHPLETLGSVATQSGPSLLILFMSTGGLSLLAPRWLLLAAPSALHNALSAHGPQHGVGHHYHVLTATGLFVAAAYGASRAPRLRRYARAWLAGGIAAAGVVAVVGGVALHHTRLTKPTVDRVAARAALDLIPPDVPVAAAPRFQPHLSQRLELYTPPEPFIPIDWGSPLKAPDYAERAARVRYVILNEDDKLFEYDGDVLDVVPLLQTAGFVLVLHEGQLRVYERR